MDAPFTAPPVADAATPAPTPPMDMDAIQRMIRDVLEQYELDRQKSLEQALDARDERLKQTIRADIKQELQPIRKALEQRVTAVEARRIAGEEVNAVKAEIKAELNEFRTAIGTSLDGMLRAINSMTERLDSLKTLPQEFENIKGQLTAYTSMRTTQDEERARAISRIETKADQAISSTETLTLETATFRNDLYGAPGGAPGVIALTFRHTEAIARATPTMERLNDFLDREEADRQKQRDTLSSLVAFRDSQVARQAKRDAFVKSLRETAIKTITNKWFWGGMALLAGGVLFALGANPDVLTPFLDLFR